MSVTLADEDTKSIPTDEAMQVMQVMQAMQAMHVMQVRQVVQVMQVMQVMQVIESIKRPFLVAKFATCKWRHLMAKFEAYASGAIWWSNLQLMQVAPSGGKICN